MKRLMLLVLLFVMPLQAQKNWPPVPVQPNAHHNTLALIMFQYEGNPIPFPPGAVATVQKYFAFPFKPFWEQNSYGYELMDIAPVYGPYTLHRPAGATGCLFQPNAELGAFMVRDIPAGSYTEPVYLHNCGSAGESSAILWGDGFLLAWDHIQGYVNQFQGYLLDGFSLFYGYGLICKAGVVTVPLSNSCTSTWHTGDPFSTKGGAHSTAGNKYKAQWLEATNRIMVTALGNFHITPLELFTTAPVFLEIHIPGEVAYTVEYRQPIGPDSFLAGSPYASAVWIRQLTSVGWALIDMHPTAKFPKWHQGMLLRESLTLPNTGAKITLQAASATGADISVH